jgi:hypothetical protein
MSSLRQIRANRENALKSTGPVTSEGKERSRCNAVRHGLTAETVIGTLEDADDYKAFEAAVIADYDAESAVERELVLRLASLLWRLRRATSIETGLMELQTKQTCKPQQGHSRTKIFHTMPSHARGVVALQAASKPSEAGIHGMGDAASCFLALAKDPSYPLDRLSRYEAILWKQAGQVIFTLYALRRRRRGDRGRQNFFRLRVHGLQRSEEY